MRTLKSVYCLLVLALCTAFVSCDEFFIVPGGGENENVITENPSTLEKYAVSGKVEKGPFVSGSTISIQPMSEKMRPLGTVYTSTIEDHLGNFSFGVNLYESPYADLAANGYFFNEVTGSLSQGTLYLRAIVDLSKSETVNVNIITHIKYQRVQNLIAQGKNYAEANAQAQEEVLAAFGLQKYAEKDASQYTIAEGTDESAVLIAISSLILIDRTEAEVTEYLARLCREFGENGTFADDTKALMSEDREKVAEELTAIRENVQNRYRELDSEVEVRNLSHFFDWNDDGTAGNETLKEGESITLSTNRLEVPYSGGSYTVKIESPIPVYLEPLHWGGDLDEIPSTDIINPDLFNDFYAYSEAKDEPIQVKKSINGNELYVEVSPLESYLEKTEKVVLYDCMGGVLDTLLIVQEANPNIAEPQFLGLGQTGLAMMASMAVDMASAVSKFNLLEQYYQHNKIGGLVERYISPHDNTVSGAWSACYKANTRLAQMRQYDEQSLNVYGKFFDVFSSMMYYYMVVGWGDVPYMLDYEVISSLNRPSQTKQDEILADMAQRLTASLEVLEEKKNESVNMTSMNDFFLVSKDVVRILLANIRMYQGKYAEAQVLLKEVIEAGYYELDASKYSNPEIFESNHDIVLGDEYFDGTTSEEQPTFDGHSKELIFVLDASDGTRATRSESVSISIASPRLVPLMTYTDVMLSYAECLYRGGNMAEAEEYLQKVVKAKGITVASDVLNGIKEARHQLLVCCNSNFAFYKRNGIAVEELGIEEHQQLLPIPQSEVYNGLTQNPGYDR